MLLVPQKATKSRLVSLFHEINQNMHFSIKNKIKVERNNIFLLLIMAYLLAINQSI